MKLKELESELQPLKGFAAPKRELEQYVTSAHLASRMIYTAATSFDDIDEKDILDIGCGCAVLSAACVMMGANSVLAVDVDPDALAVAKENLESLEMEDEVTLLNARIGTSADASTSVSSGSQGATNDSAQSDSLPLFSADKLSRKIDTCVTNPPFGTWNKGIDMVFLEEACKVARTAVYSLNKTSTRDHIQRKAKSLGFEGEVIAEMRYDLPKTMSFHKKQSVDIQVDMWRFERIEKLP